MRNNSRKLGGFILMEVLIALTIMGVVVGLFWNAKLANAEFHSQIMENLASERLVHDAKILLEINETELIELDGYNGLENYNWLPNGLVFKFKNKPKQERLF